MVKGGRRGKGRDWNAVSSPWGQRWEDEEPSSPSEKVVMEAGAQDQSGFGKNLTQPCPGRRREGSKFSWFRLTGTDAPRTLGHSSLVCEGGIRRYQSCLHRSCLCLGAKSQDLGSDLDLQLWLKWIPSAPCKTEEATEVLEHRQVLPEIPTPLGISIGLICSSDPSKILNGAALPDTGRQGLICDLFTLFSP